MNDQKFKKVSYKIDYAPEWKKPSRWKDLRLLVSVIAGVVGIIIIFAVVVIEIECQVNWRELCG